MTWSISVGGHDDLAGDEKIKFEEDLVEKVRTLVDELKNTEGCDVTSGVVNTNTTGQVNVAS